MTEIVNNLLRVRQRIDEAARNYRREPSSVRLLAVSKTKPPADIRAAYEAGQRLFGENYLQEAMEKIGLLSGLDIEWHYIGRIQSNKTRPIAENFSWVHGVYSLKHARRLAEQRPEDLPSLNVCLQVNLSGEQSKGGLPPERVPELAAAIQGLQGVRLRGLMTLPAPATDMESQRKPFHRLALLKAGLEAEGVALDTLSMGMSNDLEAAIAEGATLVRIGTAIFGAR